MAKIFVAQTHERDCRLVCDFLKTSGCNDVEPHATDPVSRVWLSRQMALMADPFVLVTSQRDAFGCDYISNLLHVVPLYKSQKTLTVVYTRAAAHQQHVAGVVRFLSDLMSTPKHGLKILPKDSEDTRNLEHDILLSYINGFEASLK